MKIKDNLLYAISFALSLGGLIIGIYMLLIDPLNGVGWSGLATVSTFLMLILPMWGIALLLTIIQLIINFLKKTNGKKLN